MSYSKVEDVFVTEGVPKVTFVRPPNYVSLLVDIRRTAKPVIVEGQSGTGKTTTVKQIIAEIYPENPPKVLTPREPDDLPVIEQISEKSGNSIFVIDDFHRLANPVKERLADLAKLVAERDDRTNLPKLVIVGINEVGSDLIQMVPDIAKRVGIHRILPGTHDEIQKIISLGCEELNVSIENPNLIFEDSRGDYWLTQQICKSICVAAGIEQGSDTKHQLKWDLATIRRNIVETLRHNFDAPVREFCRGRRFRPTNDPYYKLLRAISEQDRSSVDLNELANAHSEIRGSINNIKDRRLSILLSQKENCARLFYYDQNTKNFALEDPALFFYIKNLNWDELRQRCGFRDGAPDYEFDVAISFAGENRNLAKLIVEQLHELDISTFYDKNYEDNLLGGPWAKYFREVFTEKSRLVVAILDKFHFEKVWPTFERDCFDIRVPNAEVIPVRLDDTVFPAFPKDLVAINFKYDGDVDANKDRIIDEIVLRIAGKLDNL